MPTDHSRYSGIELAGDSLKHIFIRIAWFALAVFLLVIVLRAAMPNDSIPKPYKRYPTIEYSDDFPLPPDYLDVHDFTRARLKYPAWLDVHGPEIDGPENVIRYTMDAPKSDRALLYGIRRLTRIDTRSVEQIVELDGSNDIYNFPNLYAVECGYINLPDKQIAQLREYLLRGGTIWLDDCHGSVEFRNLLVNIRKLFPNRPILDIPKNDQVFHTVYDLDDKFQIPGGKSIFPPFSKYEYDGFDGKWLSIRDDEGRIMVYITFNQDLGDAFELADEIRYPEKYSTLAYKIAVDWFIYNLSH